MNGHPLLGSNEAISDLQGQATARPSKSNEARPNAEQLSGNQNIKIRYIPCQINASFSNFCKTEDEESKKIDEKDEQYKC